MSHDFEFYESPRAFTRYLFWALAERGYPVGGHLFEPCVGSGAIPYAFERPMRSCTTPHHAGRWTTNDLDSRWEAPYHADATQEGLWAEVTRVNGDIDFTVSNPPFTPAIEIMDHALAYSSRGVAMHLRASIHEVLKTGRRRTWMGATRPTAILWLPRFAYQRSPTTKQWTTDSVCACWVIWLKGVREQFIDYAPEWVLDELAVETPAFRKRMDALMGRRVA